MPSNKTAVVVCDEKIDHNRAHYLIDNYTFDDFFASYQGQRQDAKKQYDLIRKTLLEKVMSDNNSVKYFYSKNKKSGRLFAEGNGCQNLNGDIRAFLVDGITTDVDMANCHPCILYKLCEKLNIDCPNLKYYTEERDRVLEQLMEKDNIPKWKAKKKWIESMNYDKNIKSNFKLFNDYDKEMKIIQKNIFDCDEYKYLKEYAKEDNKLGSFLNHVLCENENNILSAIRTWCAINQLEIHSLIFDGLMIYGNHNINTIKIIEKYIHESTEFDNIHLTIKPHQYEFVMPDDYKPSKKQNYENVKEEFEKHNCKVGCKFACNKNGFVDIYGITDFKTLHMELKCFSKKKCESFIDRWLKDENKRQYDYFDGFPKDSICPKNTYNLWVKFPVEKMPLVENDKCKAGLDWFLNHLKIMVNHVPEHYDFLEFWIAQMFQYPENKSIMLTFVGEEGCGKGTFIKFMQTIMGGGSRCWECTDPQNEMFGNFNDMMKDAFLVVLNEADKAGNYNHNNKMKALITDPQINIRPKGKTNMTVKSNHRFMAMSNNPDPNIKNKRRDFTFKMSSEKVNKDEYWKQGNTYAYDIEVCKYIHNYFMEKKIKPTIVDNDIPEGIYDELLKEESKDVTVQFIEYLTYLYKDKDEPKFFTVKDLYSRYLDYCKEYYIQNYKNCRSFGSSLGFKHYKNVKNDVRWVDNRSERGWEFNFKELVKELDLKIPNNIQKIEQTSDSESD